MYVSSVWVGLNRSDCMCVGVGVCVIQCTGFHFNPFSQYFFFFLQLIVNLLHFEVLCKSDLWHMLGNEGLYKYTWLASIKTLILKWEHYSLRVKWSDWQKKSFFWALNCIKFVLLFSVCSCFCSMFSCYSTQSKENTLLLIQLCAQRLVAFPTAACWITQPGLYTDWSRAPKGFIIQTDRWAFSSILN